MGKLDNVEMWRYVYIIECDNKGIRNNKYYNKIKIYYPGQTTNLGRRLGQHIFGEGKGFTNTIWKDSIKTPLHVEYVFGKKIDAMKREKTIKDMNRTRKENLISSDKNMLVAYKRNQHCVIRNRDDDGQIVVKIA